MRVIFDDAALERLMLAAQANDESAWRQLFTMCEPLLSRPPRAMAPPWWPHLPAVNDTDFRYELEKIFYDLVLAFDPTRGVNAGAYLVIHTRHRAQNYLRSLARNYMRYVRLDSPAVLDRLADMPEIELEVAHETPYSPELRARLRTAMERLSPRQRAVLLRYYWLEQTTAEIAEELHSNEVAIRQMKHRAEARLRVALRINPHRAPSTPAVRTKLDGGAPDQKAQEPRRHSKSTRGMQ